MTLNINDSAVAIQSGNQWLLKPHCDVAVPTKGIAVKSGAQWLFSPSRSIEATDLQLISVKTGGQNLVMPLTCESDGGGSGGEDPQPHLLCSECSDSDDVSSTYNISISGMPSICDMEYFNGSWTLEYVTDCYWKCEIDEWSTVYLQAQPGVVWRVTCAISGVDGIDAVFIGLQQGTCRPESQSFVLGGCSDPMGCDGLCDALSGAYVNVS